MRGPTRAGLPVVKWACRHLLYRAQEQLHAFLRNFPSRFLAGVMHMLVFPRGLTYSAPSDRLGSSLAALVMNPTEAREELCGFIYKTAEPNNPLGLLQEALRLAPVCESIEKRIRVEGVKTGRVSALDTPGQIQQALSCGIISATEAAALQAYDAKVMDIINVDDFSPQELGAQAAATPAAVSS